MDSSLPGSSVHGIFQARVLVWAAIFPCNSWLDLFTYLISLSIYLIPLTTKLLKDLFKQVICISVTSYLNSTLLCSQNSFCQRWCCSVTKSCPIPCDPMDCSTPGFSVLHYLPELVQTCRLSQWYHPAILSSVGPFCCPQSFPASESFPTSQFFASGGQSTRASASASVLPMSIQDWFPSRRTGLMLLNCGLGTTPQSSLDSKEIKPVTKKSG